MYIQYDDIGKKLRFEICGKWKIFYSILNLLFYYIPDFCFEEQSSRKELKYSEIAINYNTAAAQNDSHMWTVKAHVLLSPCFRCLHLRALVCFARNVQFEFSSSNFYSCEHSYSKQNAFEKISRMFCTEVCSTHNIQSWLQKYEMIFWEFFNQFNPMYIRIGRCRARLNIKSHYLRPLSCPYWFVSVPMKYEHKYNLFII